MNGAEPGSIGCMQKTVVKCLKLIEALSRGSGPQGITELARELKLGKSNIHRLVNTLEEMGYARRLPDLGKYEPTLKLWEVGVQILQRLDVRDAARTHMQWLTEKIRETVHLSVLDDCDVVYIDKIESDYPVRAYSQLGGRAPAYCVATGKALLSCLTDDRVLAACPKLKALTPNTIQTHDALLKDLAAVRRQGYAVNNGERWPNVAGAASPIYDSNGRAIAAIGISGPTERLKPRILRRIGANEVATAARMISAALGYRPR
jgi:IclR family transcriptional regulator, KDG regulon repressor